MAAQEFQGGSRNIFYIFFTMKILGHFEGLSKMTEFSATVDTRAGVETLCEQRLTCARACYLARCPVL